MHKIVIGVDNLEVLSDLLTKDEIKFKLWIEKPENIPTCLATKPYSKTFIEKYFKTFKLYR